MNRMKMNHKFMTKHKNDQTQVLIKRVLKK